LNRACHANEKLAWSEVDGDFEEEEFHTSLGNHMESGTIVAPQPTLKTYLEVDSHVHSIIMEQLNNLNNAHLSPNKFATTFHNQDYNKTKG
jgi:hypothetical protein